MLYSDQCCVDEFLVYKTSKWMTVTDWGLIKLKLEHVSVSFCQLEGALCSFSVWAAPRLISAAICVCACVRACVRVCAFNFTAAIYSSPFVPRCSATSPQLSFHILSLIFFSFPTSLISFFQWRTPPLPPNCRLWHGPCGSCGVHDCVISKQTLPMHRHTHWKHAN